MKLPQARTADILEQEAGNELLIYDLRTNKMLQLNETSKIIYKACGTVSFAQLKRKYKFTDQFVDLALDELNKNDLLENYQSTHSPGLSRREVVSRAGLSTMLALPVITGLIVPSAAHAASTTCVGVCLRANTPICAACGKTSGVVNFDNYDSRDGRCVNRDPNNLMGAIACRAGDTTSVSFDLRITSVR